jgi:hypothetical protein
VSIRIDELNPTDLPSREHFVPAMKDGLTVMLTVGQIVQQVGFEDVQGLSESLDDKADLSDIASKANASDTNIHTLTAKALPVDGDEIRIADSANSWAFKKVTLVSLWAWISAKVLTLFGASGAAPVYASRAWVNFNGSGTVSIRSSGNVSSITDLGVGYYRVNFATALPDANYAALATAGHSVAGTNVAHVQTNTVPSTAGFDVVTVQGGAAVDLQYCFAAAFR